MARTRRVRCRARRVRDSGDVMMGPFLTVGAPKGSFLTSARSPTLRSRRFWVLCERGGVSPAVRDSAILASRHIAPLVALNGGFVTSAPVPRAPFAGEARRTRRTGETDRKIIGGFKLNVPMGTLMRCDFLGTL